MSDTADVDIYKAPHGAPLQMPVRVRAAVAVIHNDHIVHVRLGHCRRREDDDKRE